MAADGPKISEINAKILRLDTVFKKAIDVSSNSLNNADLDNCFMDLKSQFGNVLPKLYMNMIAKSQINIEASYKDICILWDLEESMRTFELPPASSSSSAPTTVEEMDLTTAEDPLPSHVLKELKEAEAECLRDAIQNLEAEIEKMEETTSRLRTHIGNQIMAVKEEDQKLSNSISS